MARIPIYNQGRGSTQQLATGSLSPTANVGAFAAPGQALASFANSAGQIAFDFGMAERRKQDEDAIQNTNAKFIEDSTQYIRENPTDNTQTFKTNYKNWKDNWVDKNVGNLGSRRKRLVLNKVNRSFALENLKGQQKAYNLGEFNAINATNQELDKLNDIMQNYPPSSAEYLAAESDKNLIFDNNKKYGRNYKFNQYSFDLSVTKGNFLKQAPSINSEAAYNNFQKDVDNNKTLSFSEKSALKTIGETQFKTNKSNQIDGILKTLVSANSTGPTILDAQSAVISGKNSFTYQEGNETKTISFANLDLDGKQLLQQELGLLANQTQNVVLRSGNASLTTFLQTNPSLASMKNKQKDIDNRTGEFKDVSFEVRTKLSNRLGKKITEKVAKSKVIFDNNLTKITNSISVNGEINENTEQIINENKNLALAMDDTGVMANSFTNTLKSTNDAISLFNETNFDTEQEISAALNTLNKEERLETDPSKQLIITKKKELFTKMHANRRKAIKDDPYTYFETAKIKNDPDGPKPTPREILNLQIEAGVPVADRRLISVATENNFVKSYNETTDLNDKFNLYNQFFSQFDNDDQNSIIKNMRRRESITLRDNIFLSEPNNLVAGDLFTSNSDSVKASVKGLPKTERDSIVLKVREQLANYSESISGQITTNYNFAPEGATEARVDHTLAMQNLAYDLAGFYYVAGKLSLDEAVKKATDNLINNKFDFITPGDADGVVRLPKSIVGTPKLYEKVLDIVFENNTNNQEIFDNLTFVSPSNDIDGKYKKEVLKKGKFVTKSDNSGVILVDLTGNPVIVIKEDEKGNITQNVFQLSFEQIAVASQIYSNTRTEFQAEQIAVQNYLKDFY
jgi:hypothetical protein